MSGVPVPPNDAERLVRALWEEHGRVRPAADEDDESPFPAWVLHLPGGGHFQIKRIGVRGPFVRFDGYGASETIHDSILVAPEAVVISIATVKQPFDPFERHRPLDRRLPIEFEDYFGTTPERVT